MSYGLSPDLAYANHSLTVLRPRLRTNSLASSKSLLLLTRDFAMSIPSSIYGRRPFWAWPVYRPASGQNQIVVPGRSRAYTPGGHFCRLRSTPIGQERPGAAGSAGEGMLISS